MDQPGQLRQSVEHEKDKIKKELIRLGYYKTPCGRQLYELTLTELEQIRDNLHEDRIRFEQ